MTQPANREQALALITELCDRFSISAEDIRAALNDETASGASTGWVPRVLGYLGAAFVFGGLCLFAGMIWDDLPSAARVIISFGPGTGAFILGLICIGEDRFRRAGIPLFLIAATLQPTGMFVFLKEYTDGNDAQLAAMLVFAILAAQYLITYYARRQTSLLFFGFLFWNAAIGILMDRAGVPGEWLGLGLGLSILFISYKIDRGANRAIAPFWYFIGALGFFWAVYDLVEDAFPLDLLMLVLAVTMMMASVRLRSRTLLTVSTLVLLGFLGYFTEEYFSDVTGWPLALMLMGFMLIGVSYWAVSLGRRIKG